MNRPTAVTQRRDGHSDRRRVTAPALGRTTTWVLALWSGYIAAWAAVSGSAPVIVAAWWLAGAVLVQSIAHRAAPMDAAHSEATRSSQDTHVAPAAFSHEAVQAWESEGGATA